MKGLMSHWTGETRGGIYEEILDRCIALEQSWGIAADPVTTAGADCMGTHGNRCQLINHEVLHSVFLEMCEEARVDVRLYSFASAPVIEAAAATGAPFIKGREYDGKKQSMTDMLKVGGVDTGQVLIYPTSLPGTVVLNMTNCIKVDGTKTSDMVRAERTCRSQIRPILEFMAALAAPEHPIPC